MSSPQSLAFATPETAMELIRDTEFRAETMFQVVGREGIGRAFQELEESLAQRLGTEMSEEGRPLFCHKPSSTWEMIESYFYKMKNSTRPQELIVTVEMGGLATSVECFVPFNRDPKQVACVLLDYAPRSVRHGRGPKRLKLGREPLAKAVITNPFLAPPSNNGEPAAFSPELRARRGRGK